MKKILAICILFSVVIISCHKKAVPAMTDRNVTSPVVTGPTIVAYPEADVTAGKTLYETKCNRCHGLKNTAVYTVERWPGIMKSMAPKAKLNDEETRQVTAYVMTNAKKAS